MDRLLEEAFLEAIYTEKKSMAFYKKMASSMQDQETRKMFEHLATEEEEHLEGLINCFSGSGFELLRALEKQDFLHEELYRECSQCAENSISAKQALEISLREEQACIDRYSTFVASIREPHIREVFERTLEETRGHYDMISDEYMRVMGMVNGSDQETFVRE